MKAGRGGRGKGRGGGPGRREGPARGVTQRGPRSAALSAALLGQKRGASAEAVIEELRAGGELTERDRRLAEELAFGAVRHRASLDLVLGAVSSRELARVDLAVREALRQAVYQTFYLTRIPDHAAVDEAVRLCRALVGGSAAGFANAVLRAALALRAGRGFGRVAGAERRSALAWRGGEHVRLARPLLPDPEADRAGWLAAHYSYPRWLVGELEGVCGPERAEEILAWGNEVPPITVRVNPLSTDLAALAGREPAGLCAAGEIFSGCASAVRGELPGSWRLKPELPVGELPGLRKGLFTVQDETQQRAAAWLEPAAGERVLDLCAAPGGKTTALAELAGGKAEVLACDPDAERLKLVAGAAERLGLAGIATRELAVPPLPADLAGGFDKVLADVPCSNTGAMNRRVEARWRAKPEAIAELAGRQRAILGAALEAARPGGGHALYSTCSLLPAENQEVVAAVLAGRSGWKLLREETVLPRAGVRDGGFFALIEQL